MSLRHYVACSLVLGGCLAGCSSTQAPEPSGTTQVPTGTNALRAPQLMVPVAGVAPHEVADDFRARRAGGRIHHAVDIPAPRGTPVLSADDGHVLRLSWNRRGGRTIYATDTSGRFIYYYAHLNGYRRGLAPGTPLVHGQVIGFVGTTGNAKRRAPHLHFQVMVRAKDGRPWRGKPIDPQPLFTRAGRAGGQTTALASDAGQPG